MLQPWNNSSLLPPPVNMFLCVKKVDIFTLKHVCSNIIKVLSKQSPLHKESAICSRFLYKYDRKFRNDIGYRNLKKVHTALKRYLTLNLLKDVDNFLSALPSDNDDEKYLPTRQMLEYVMLRIITFSMIMLRICVCSKQAAIFYLNRIKRSESHWMSLLPYALLSRLWSITMVLVQHSTNWYSNLYSYLNKLELKGLPFLPDDYELPNDLEQWLDLKNIDNFGRFDWDQRNITFESNALFDGDDDANDLFDNILNFVNQTNKNESEDEDVGEVFETADKSKEHKVHFEATEVKTDQDEVISRESYIVDHGVTICRESFKCDHGEALSRQSYNILLNTSNNSTRASAQHSSKGNKPVKPNKALAKKIVKQFKDISEEKVQESNKHSHKNVSNAITLKEFIKNEERYRNESDHRSLTNHLSLMQWHALKNSALKLCDALTNRKIERKFQKVWQQKCLDYK